MKISEYKDIIFDLDGTIIDSKQGIINSLIYSIGKMGYNVFDKDAYIKYIGLSLEDIYRDVFNTDNETIIKKAIDYYREDFSKNGIYQNILYPGIEKILEYLFENNFDIYLASIKPAIYSTEILRYHNLKKYFRYIIGSELNGENSDKSYMIKTIIDRFSINPIHTIMIGDRQGDIIAAHNNNIHSVGVLYGYGVIDEFKKAGAQYIIRKPEDILNIFQSNL